MATFKTISAALQLVETKKQNLKKAYDDLLQHSHSSLLSSSSSSSSSSSFPLDWSLLDSHFTSFHNNLTQRFLHLQSLESQQTPNPNDPSPSTSKFPDTDPKVTNFSALPNDPSSSSVPIPQTGAAASSVKNHAEAIHALCKNMDGKGLRNYVGDNVRDKAAIKAELRVALKRAPDPAAMVLDSANGVFGGAGIKVKDAGELRKLKRSCSVLFQQLRFAGPNLSGEVKRKAKRLATAWKGSLVSDSAGGDSVGAMAFLHFVTAYELLSELTVNELATFSAMAAANDELPELYQIIGLTDKVPALIQKLIDKGKHVLAVKYVFQFNLADKIPPVPILEAYLNESQKLARRLTEEGKSLSEITARETHALRSVIKVIENHNLESEYPSARLEERIKQLQMHKANGKHSAPAFATKPPQPQSGIKRPRISAPVGPAAITNNIISAASTMHQYQQPIFQSTGLLPLPEHPDPHMGLPAGQYGLVAPAPSISPYQGPPTGPYSHAGVPMGPRGNPGQSGSHPSASEPYVPSGYYDGNVSAYGDYGLAGLQHYYQTSYPQ